LLAVQQTHLVVFVVFQVHLIMDIIHTLMELLVQRTPVALVIHQQALGALANVHQQICFLLQRIAVMQHQSLAVVSAKRQQQEQQQLILLLIYAEVMM
jgi:hypothetical protein